MKNILLILALIIGFSAQSQTSLTTAVDFTETDLNGNTHNLFSILNQGHWAVLNFGAYWCGPCASLASDFGQAYEDYGCNTGDVFFIELELEGSNSQCEDFVNTYGGGYDVPYLCSVTSVLNAYGIQAFPTVILINPSGDIVEQDIWPVDYSILTNTLNSYGLSAGNCNATGITELQLQENDIKIFDVLGREWTDYKSLPNGFFIQDGKKYFKNKK